MGSQHGAIAHDWLQAELAYDQQARGPAADRTANDDTISLGEWLRFSRDFELCPLISVESLKRVRSSLTSILLPAVHLAATFTLTCSPGKLVLQVFRAAQSEEIRPYLIEHKLLEGALCFETFEVLPWLIIDSPLAHYSLMTSSLSAPVLQMLSRGLVQGALVLLALLHFQLPQDSDPPTQLLALFQTLAMSRGHGELQVIFSPSPYLPRDWRVTIGFRSTCFTNGN